LTGNQEICKGKKYIFCTIACETADGDEITTPILRYKLG